MWKYTPLICSEMNPPQNGTLIKSENKLYTHNNYITNEAALETFKTYESCDDFNRQRRFENLPIRSEVTQ